MVMAVSVYGERHITSEELAAAAHTLLSSLFLLVCLQSGLPAAVHWELSCQDWQWPPCCPTHDNALHQLLGFSALVSPSGLSPHFVFVSFLSFFFPLLFCFVWFDFGLGFWGIMSGRFWVPPDSPGPEACLTPNWRDLVFHGKLPIIIGCEGLRVSDS